MDLFGRKAIKQLSQRVKALQSQNTFALNPARNIAVYPGWESVDIADRYSNTDDIYSIIRLLSTTAALIPLYGYLQTPDAKSFNKLVREQKKLKEFNARNYRALQTKALEDLPETDPVAMLLENPNQKMSKFEFFESVYSFLFLTGEAFILKEKPDMGVNAGKAVQLQILYPKNVIIKVSESLPREIVAYDYRVNGTLIYSNIPASDIIHIKYWNPNMDYVGNELRGLSPLQALQRRLVRMDSNMDVSVAQMQNGGVETIVYDKAPSDLDAVEVSGARKDNYYRFAKNPSNAGMPFFASGEMGAVQIGSHLSDMGIADIANIDFKKLCNVWGVSDVLFNSSDTNSENNVAIQTKRLYTNTVLPNVYRVRDAIVKGLLSDFQNGVVITSEDGTQTTIKGDGKQRYVDADISDITELHEDLGKRATWMASAYWLTNNEKREMMNYERYDDPVFDEPLLPAGLQKLSDFEDMGTLPIITPNGN